MHGEATRGRPPPLQARRAWTSRRALRAFVPVLLALARSSFRLEAGTRTPSSADESRRRGLRRRHSLGLSLRRGHRRRNRGPGAACTLAPTPRRTAPHHEPDNPQLGGVEARPDLHEPEPSAMVERELPSIRLLDPLGSVCEAKVLDVKATRSDAPLLFHAYPALPRHQAQSPDTDRRDHRPDRAAADRSPAATAVLRRGIFYDEGSPTKDILDVKPFRHICLDPDDLSDCILGAPPGSWALDHRARPTDLTRNLGPIQHQAKTGVVVATSVRPACGAGTPPAGPPCLSTLASVIGTPDQRLLRRVRNRGAVLRRGRDGAAQTVRAGVHFIRGHTQGNVGIGRPALRKSWLENVDCPPQATPASSTRRRARATCG